MFVLLQRFRSIYYSSVIEGESLLNREELTVSEAKQRPALPSINIEVIELLRTRITNVVKRRTLNYESSAA